MLTIFFELLYFELDELQKVLIYLMKINKLLFTTATIFAISTNLFLSEAKAGQSLFDFKIDGVKWDLKIDKSGANAGKLFLRKNKKSTKCKQYVFDVNTAKSFLSCASKKIGKKYIKEYIVNPIDKEIPGAKKFIMAAYNMI